MNYYYCEDGATVRGPASIEEMRELMAMGTLSPRALICAENTENWLSISSIATVVPELSPPPIPQKNQPVPQKARKSNRITYWIIICVIVLTVGYLGVVATTAIIFTQDATSQAQQMRTDSDIRGIMTQLKLYKAQMWQLPTTEEGLEVLVTKPASAGESSRWRQLLERVPLDPWSRPYQYRNPGKRNPDEVEVYSLGPDGEDDTADDIFANPTSPLSR
ncbi:MAG: type II secretion system major pseudopilin GspG [Verrucomicrobiales bacterium]